MEYIALFGGFGTAHTSKDKNLSGVILDEITALVDCPQVVEKSFQMSPASVIVRMKRGEPTMGWIRSYNLEGVPIGQN